MTDTKIVVTIERLKSWADENRRIAETVLLAQAFAECERARVDAYTRPIFDSYDFRDEDGQPITRMDRLHHCPDDAKCAAYYAACNRAHVAHGWTGDPEHCPALTAESLLIEAQNALLQAAESIGLCGIYRLDLRKRALDLLLGVCLGGGKARTADQIIRGERRAEGK